MPDSITYRRHHPDDSIPAITALLHQAYAPLAQMGLRFYATHQNDDDTRHRLAGHASFIAEHQNQIIGTLTLYAPHTDPRCNWYCRPGVFKFGQFAVHPDLQRRGIGSHLLRLAEEHALHSAGQELALDTAENAHHLRAWYDRLGFRYIEHVQWQTTNYRSVILSKTLAR